MPGTPCRALVRDKTFSVTAVLTLGVGLALASVAFTLFNAYVLRPFAVADPGACTRCTGSARIDPFACIRGATTRSIRARRDVFADALASRGVFVTGVYTALVGQAGERQLFPDARRAHRTGPGNRRTRYANTARRQRGGAWAMTPGNRPYQLDPGVLGKKLGIARPHLRNDRRRRPGVRRPGRIAARLLGADFDACSLS